MNIVVIGAGVIGASTALVLAERGLDVTVIEREAEPGAGTSHANGSSLTPWHAEPWNAPGIWRRLPSALVRRGGPWCVRPRALPGLLGWGAKFVHHSSAARYYRNARHCVRLGLYSTACLDRIRRDHDLHYDQITRGSLELYFSGAELEHAIELRRRLKLPGLDYRLLDRDELVELEPALAAVAGQVHGSLLFPTHESGDARVFSIETIRRAAALGARMRFEAGVKRIRIERGRLHSIETNRGIIEADACIIAAGCDSPALLKPLGLHAPIQPAKGCSLTLELEPGDPAPTLPVLDLQRRFVVARLGHRLRIAGLADFAGFDRSIDPKRIRLLRDNACALLPRLAERIRSAELHPWAGLRPMTPDGAPLIGPTPIAGLHLNAGHGSMGWTQAAGSAELVADLVTGRTPAIDPDGLLAARWLQH